MTNCFKYVCMFISLFFVLNINVKAELKKNGDCIYNFTGDLKNMNGALSIKIHQDDTGNITYYYVVGESIKTPNDSKWQKEKSGMNGFHIEPDKNANFWDSAYSYCPKFAHFRSQTLGYDILFSDNSSESSYEASTANSYSELKSSVSSNGEKATCAQTKVNWLKPVPSVDEIKEHDAHCLYYGENDKGCHIVQLDYDSKTKKLTSTANFLAWSGYKHSLFYAFDDNKVKKRLKHGCPSELGIDYDVSTTTEYDNIINYVYKFQGGNYLTMSLKSSSSSISETTLKDTTIISGQMTKIDSCDQLLNDELTSALKNVIGFIRVLVPIILIALGVVDFGMAVFAGDEDKMKKSQNKFIKRLIIGAVIFIIPNVLKTLLTIAHEIWPVVDATLCGII